MESTEVRNIQASITSIRQKAVEEQQQAELFGKLMLRVVCGAAVIIAFGFIGNAIWGMVNRKVTNEQKVEQVIGVHVHEVSRS